MRSMSKKATFRTRWQDIAKEVEEPRAVQDGLGWVVVVMFEDEGPGQPPRICDILSTLLSIYSTSDTLY